MLPPKGCMAGCSVPAAQPGEIGQPQMLCRMLSTSLTALIRAAPGSGGMILISILKRQTVPISLTSSSVKLEVFGRSGRAGVSEW
jgi:hypothetical protein